MIDTHAHLDACADPAEAVVERARAAGVRRILTVGTTTEGSREALALAEQHPEVLAIVGIHPHDAGGRPDLGEIRELASRERAVAIGETGLDFFRDYAPRDHQRALFEQQLALADELRMPVVVHTRAAERETLEVLRTFDGRVVLHCFSSARMLAPALERRYYVSFAGNVTYKNAPELRVAAAQVPADRLLVETDAPYLSPQPVRGKSNEPAHVVHTFDVLAQVRGIARDELAAQIEANAAEAFALP